MKTLNCDELMNEAGARGHFAKLNRQITDLEILQQSPEKFESQIKDAKEEIKITQAELVKALVPVLKSEREKRLAEIRDFVIIHCQEAEEKAQDLCQLFDIASVPTTWPSLTKASFKLVYPVYGPRVFSHFETVDLFL